MNLLAFAWRNLLRNRRRSFLAVISTFIATLLVVAGNGLTEGFIDSMVRNYTKNETGHIHIATTAYRERARFMPVDEYIQDANSLVQTIEQNFSDRRGSAQVLAAPRTRFAVLLSSGTFTKPAVAIAGDPEKERRLLMLDRNILSGGSYCTEPGTAIIGSMLARDLHLKAGDRLKIVTTRADGGMGFKSLRISGIFHTGTNALDGSVFQMRLDDAQALLGMGKGAQQILVMLPDYRRISSYLPAARNLLQSAGNAGIVSLSGEENASRLTALPWTDIGDYPKMILLANGIYVGMWFFIALLGAFIIANIMTMVVLERRRETGILMAMGMPPRNIALSFLLEGTMLGFGGSLLGTAAGTAFNLAFSRTGFDFSSAMAGFSWPIDNIIRPAVTAGGIVSGLAYCTIAAMLMSWLPSWRASRMDVVDALASAQ